MGMMVGGPKAWKVRQHGDIGVAFHWVNDEPAMVLFPARKSLPGAGAYVIALSAAYKYADSKTGGPTLYLIERSVDAAEQLGFSRTDTFAARKIADVIVDSLADLVAMPPTPQTFNERQTKAIAGELAIIREGEVIHEAEVPVPDASELLH